LGAKQISLTNINDFLATRPKSEAVYKSQKGDEWLLKVVDSIIPDSFNYYYDRLKKFSLLRAYNNFGVDVSDIYDPDNILDAKKKQQQEDILDNSTLVEIADIIDNKIEGIRLKFVDNCYEESIPAGDDIFDLIESFKFRPEVGVPLYGPYINTVTRGARLKKFYLRSAATGVGKTRSMIADAC
jgi:replicative DNA helicase